MKKALLYLVAISAATVAPCAAQIQTVELSYGEPVEKFTVAAKEGVAAALPSLTFVIRNLPADAKFSSCRLRIVPLPHADPANQDVRIMRGGKQAGLLSTSQRTHEVVGGELRPEACAPGKQQFTLTTESPRTSWDYYGGGASNLSNQPRLIITYTDTSPAPARSGQSTDWKYDAPTQPCTLPASCLDPHFTTLWAQLPTDPLANLVTYDGAVYAIAGPPVRLYRVSGPGQMADWPLNFPVTGNSFALVDPHGLLRIITKDLVISCDLPKPGPDTRIRPPLQCSTLKEKITVNPGETPAIGPDGTLYFKNVEEHGSVVALKRLGQEIWSTTLKATKVSPITLSANGRHAYMLADIAVERAGAAHSIELLSIDTATGDEVATPVKDANKQAPVLGTLLQPAVATKENPVNKRTVDYVFVAGNTNDSGMLQLVAFEPSKDPAVLWTRPGKISAGPLLGVKDGNSLFALQNSQIMSFSWYPAGAYGAYSDKEMKAASSGSVDEKFWESTFSPAAVRTLLVDGNDVIYTRTLACGGVQYCWSLRTVNPPPGFAELNPTEVPSFFTSAGVLIGFRDRRIYDLSPEGSSERYLMEGQLQPWTIYTADILRINPSPTSGVKGPVVLKGHEILLPNDFKPSLFPALNQQIVPK